MTRLGDYHFVVVMECVQSWALRNPAEADEVLEREVPALSAKGLNITEARVRLDTKAAVENDEWPWLLELWGTSRNFSTKATDALTGVEEK